MLLSGICPDLTPEDREVKRQLGKCSPLDVFRSDQVGHSRLFRCEPFLFPLFDISSALCHGNFSWGPLVVKLTRGELRVHVELLEKKRRSVKFKAQDPPESSLPARGKVPKLGVFDPRSHTQVQVKG